MWSSFWSFIFSLRTTKQHCFICQKSNLALIDYSILCDLQYIHCLTNCSVTPVCRSMTIIYMSENGWKLCAVGKGEIPILEHLFMLKIYGYDGYLSLEWEKYWHSEIEETRQYFRHLYPKSTNMLLICKSKYTSKIVSSVHFYFTNQLFIRLC